MSRNIEEIQEFINNDTIFDNLMNDCTINLINNNNSIEIIFPDWLDYLEDSSKNKIILAVKKLAPIVINNMYPDNKVSKIELKFT